MFLVLVIAYEFREQERDHFFVNPLLKRLFLQDVRKVPQGVVVLILTVVFVLILTVIFVYLVSWQKDRKFKGVGTVGIAMVTDVTNIVVLPVLWFCKR